MKVTRFDAAGDLLIVGAHVWGPGGRGQDRLRLAIDTGSSETLIKPDVVDELGYSPRHGEAITSVRAALGKEHGYTLRVSRFRSLGYSVPDFRVHVFDLPEGSASMACSACPSCASSTTRSAQVKAACSSSRSSPRRRDFLGI